MAQRGFPFACDCGDGREITAEDWQLMNELLFIGAANEGVIPSTLAAWSGRLAATNMGSNIIRISPGAAVIRGALAMSDANEDFDATGPGGGLQVDLIVMRYVFLDCAPRLVLKPGIPGGAAATLQQDAVMWEIPIATITKATGVNVTALADARQFLHFATKVSRAMNDDGLATSVMGRAGLTAGPVADIQATVDNRVLGYTAAGGLAWQQIVAAMIAAGTITPNEIANRTRKFFVPAYTAYNQTDAVHVTRDNTQGVLMDDNKQVSAYCSFIVPKDFVSGMTVRAVVLSANNGNVYNFGEAYYGAVGEDFSTHTDTFAFAAQAVVTNILAEVASLALTNAAIDDYVSIRYIRNSTNVLDTVGAGVFISGWVVEYTADS